MSVKLKLFSMLILGCIKEIRKLLITCSFCALLFLQNSAWALQLKNLTILAEPNMVEALTKISRLYSQKTLTTISVGFGNSSELISDIEMGEPADIFISAHRYWIDNLKQKGLVDIYNIGHIANDSVVLATSKENIRIPSELLSSNIGFKASLESLNKYRLNLIIDNNGSSLGQYSKHLVKKLNLDKIKLYEKLEEDKTSVANLIKNNPDSYTIFLGSQIKDSQDFRVISTLKNKQIFYQALVVAGDNMESAREFLKFLKSAQAKKIFEESGFIIDGF